MRRLEIVLDESDHSKENMGRRDSLQVQKRTPCKSSSAMKGAENGPSTAEQHIYDEIEIRMD